MPASRVGRDAVLQCLDAVYPGISPKNIIEQSGSFVFKGGRVYTFNDETACVMRSPFDKGFTAAVPAAALIEILRKLPEDELDFTLAGGELVIGGKRKKTGVTADADITLPIDGMERPGRGDWAPLNDEFADAVSLVQECASTDGTMFTMTCVHVHPDWVEACDDHQLARYTLKTGLRKPTLVKRDSIKNVVDMGMTELAETANWLHFRNPAKMQMSCRRYMEAYTDMTKPLTFTDARPVTLPKGLAEAVARCEVFSKENADDNELHVELRKGAVRVKGRGASGWHQEVKKTVYDGPDLSFTIAPKMLAAIVDRHNDCMITGDRLKADAGKFVYVTSLGAADDGGK